MLYRIYQCPVLVIPAVYTGGMPWYVPYRTHGRFFPYSVDHKKDWGQTSTGCSQCDEFMYIHSRFSLSVENGVG